MGHCTIPFSSNFVPQSFAPNPAQLRHAQAAIHKCVDDSRCSSGVVVSLRAVQQCTQTVFSRQHKRRVSSRIGPLLHFDFCVSRWVSGDETHLRAEDKYLTDRYLRSHLPTARRADRLDQRDALIREMGDPLIAAGASGRGAAAEIYRLLHDYAATGWRFEKDRPNEDSKQPDRRRKHQILTLNGGRVTRPSQLRNILASCRSRP